jgi:ribonuclease HI
LKKEEKKEVILYSDGSSLGNPGAGGYGGILDYNGKRKIFSGGDVGVTNNQMELKAVIEGLKLLKEPCKVLVVTDSSYVADAINSWLSNWIKKDFKGVKNIDLWREYLEVAKNHQVSAKWVRGHSGHEENELCDKLAREEAYKYKKDKRR